MAIKLGDACIKIGSGATPTGGKSSYLDRGPFALVRSQNVYNHGFEIGGLAFISDQQASKLNGVAVLPGDVLLNITGDSVARACLAPESLGPARVNQHVAIIRPDPNKLDARYLRYYLVNRSFQEHMLALASVGATRPALTKGMIESFEIGAPGVLEQREIGSILGGLDDKIELNRRMAATLEEMARALYRSWFVDFDPVKAKAEGLAPAFMDEATAALFPDRFGDDGLPEGWEMRRLGDLLTLNYGKALKKEVRQPGQYPVYGSGGSDSSHVEPLVSYPTIIVGRKGTVGSIYWSPRGCWPIDTTYYVSGSYPMVYALHILRGLPLSEMNTDAAVPGLNRENAYRLEVPFPGEALVAAFSNLAAAIQEKIDMIDQEISTLAALRDTLLPKLMSGELRVGEAREQVEDAA